MLGIEPRHWCGPDESTADLAREAGRLGLVNAGTFELNAGCAGFMTALDTAWK
jgi:3-oxoacyl-[acyl-carrier-protein] synthase-3